ncbi:putative sugar epimerase YhfK [Paraliobacillus quinghaiensis]|uniref:Sugar epimerase YhfK n=1 Tax=Paraliobacillus quinghaiensis TaxID=470815 RepID=A0A917TD46_9BACI|nr:SDR family oxidoreductase [Paraliobacillus quinghaiensis]GGM18434.1 putative sugar epimerase YhfK [Paraliobacillus quinghaiensis]
MKVLVVGANGQIGRHLVDFIQDSGKQARAMIRKEEQASYFIDKDAETAVVDLERSVEEIAEAAKGVDAVVFTAGSGPHTGKDKTILVDLDGAIKTMEAAEMAGVKRFVLVSSFDTRRETWLDAPEGFKPYAAAKYYADVWLKSSDLDYTLVHPGGLTNDQGTGKVEAASEVERGKIPREDVARVIINCLEEESTIGKEFQVVSGDQPIEDAVKSV